MITIPCKWAKISSGQIPVFDKTKNSPLLVLSDSEVIDQTKDSRGILHYFIVAAKTKTDIHDRIRDRMKKLYNDGKQRGIKGSFIGVIRDFMSVNEEYYGLVGLGYTAEKVVFEAMSAEQCAEFFLPVDITV